MIRFENLPHILVALAGCVALHDWGIWKVNLWWSHRHPTQARHPFSPLFTAIGVSYVCACAAFVIPPRHALFVFSLFFVYGGIMGLLHFRRWWIRQGKGKTQIAK